MIIIQLTGGLGNQLFRYSAAKAVAIRKNQPLLLDLTYNDIIGKPTALQNFILTEKPADKHILTRYYNRGFATKVFQRLLPRKHRDIYKERFFHYDNAIFNINDDVLLKGLFQSERYFLSESEAIRSALRIKESVIKDVEPLGRHLASNNSVSVHVRRGDYLSAEGLRVLGLQNQDYYLKSARFVEQQVGKIEIYYFTDDVEWVETQLVPVMPGTIISKRANARTIEDFYLMSKCRHHIIANSSFSWWAAWLNNNPDKKVIAPRQWFNEGPKDTQDLIPGGWTVL